jgi:hypothetical protein
MHDNLLMIHNLLPVFVNQLLPNGWAMKAGCN